MRLPADIARDNDLFRNTLFTSPRHKITWTSGVDTLRQCYPERFQELLTQLRAFSAFTKDNDPWGEHDFGKVTVEGDDYLWKIDYYDLNYEYGADPKTQPYAMLLTLMRSDEY